MSEYEPEFEDYSPAPAVSLDDVSEAYQDGYNDALDYAIVLVKSALKQVQKGGELRHREVLTLLRSLEDVQKQ